MKTRTQQRKDEILQLIETLFSDTAESREDQQEALEEILSECEGKIEALKCG